MQTARLHHVIRNPQEAQKARVRLRLQLNLHDVLFVLFVDLPNLPKRVLAANSAGSISYS